MKFFSLISVSFLLASCSFWPDQVSQAQKPLPNPTPPIAAIKVGDPLPANAFVELAKAINPAVVNISTSTTPRSRQGRDPFFDMLEQFYGYRIGPQQQQGRPQQALGTGFIIRDDGLIVTNTHVVAGADVIQVQLSDTDKKLYDAKLIGSDQRTDIALIKIEAGVKLPVAQLGSSKDLQVGEWVAAFGNPFGQGHTMTKGIVSALGRDISEINRLPLIQTDTPINPGNSGGPLVNLRGLVIGVNSAIDARAQGIGFAIPVDEVKAIIPQLEKTGRIKTGYLGIGLDDVNEYVADQLGLKEAKGALVVGVERGSPAARAGVKPYDVIVELNGKNVEDRNDLLNAVAGAKIGAESNLKVMRDGKLVNLSVKIGERPDEKSMAAIDTAPAGERGINISQLDFFVSEQTPRLQKEFKLNPELKGYPVITQITPNGKAARAGLRPGEVILDVNRTEVKSAKDISRLVKKGANTLRVAREDFVRIVIIRD